MRYKVKVTVEFNLDANPSDPYATVGAHRSLSGEYVFGDVAVCDPEWLPGWCTHLPPEFGDGMLVMPPDVKGDSSYTLLSQIRGPIKVHHENLGVYGGLEPGMGVCVDSKDEASQEKVGGFCEANKDGIPVSQVGEHPSSLAEDLRGARQGQEILEPGDADQPASPEGSGQPSAEVEVDDWVYRQQHPRGGMDAGRNLFWLEGVRRYVLVETREPDSLILRFLVQGQGRYIAKRYMSDAAMLFLTRAYMSNWGRRVAPWIDDLAPFVPEVEMAFQLTPGNDLDKIPELLRTDLDFFEEPTPRAICLKGG